MVSASPSLLTRRERRKLEVRNRILEAALALFDLRGFKATKVADICERADVAHKTFFNHYPTKQHLLREIADEILQGLLVRVEEAQARPGSTGERLAYFFHAVAARAEEAGPMRRELLMELIHLAHEEGTEPDQARRLHVAFEAFIRRGLAAGDVTRTHSVETLAEMVLGAFYSIMLSWVNLDDYPLGERAAAVARFLGEAMAPEGRTSG